MSSIVLYMYNNIYVLYIYYIAHSLGRLKQNLLLNFTVNVFARKYVVVSPCH